jgi:hypothetical protein
MKKTLFAFILSSSFFPFAAKAAGLVPCGGEGDPCTFCDLFILFNNIIKFLMFDIVPPVAVLMLVVGGIMYFFGGSNPELLSQAKGIIKSVAIGLAIIFCSWIIINTILAETGIVESESLLNWYNIECN